MHRLLKWQLRKHFGSDVDFPEEWSGFLEVINQTYHNNDADRRLIERSLELASNELVERNRKLQQELEERRRAEEQIHWLAYHDYLTGLSNRCLLEDRLSIDITGAKDTDGRVAILFLDLDRFKTINDSLGHQVGDNLLRLVAKRLEGCVRAGDIVCRLGGDEFIIVLCGVVDAGQAAAAAQKIGQILAVPFVLADTEFHVTASIGISLYPDDGTDIDTLISNADAAMYSVKENGRGHFQFFVADMSIQARERLSLENNLRRAIERGELVLHYQPQLDLASGRIIAVEALVRWQHPELGLLGPDRFIPVAEESGLIVPLGKWVLETACRTVRAWHTVGLPAITVAVNLSARQFRQHDMSTQIGRILAEVGIDPGFLELELTESMVMEDPAQAALALRELSMLGVPIAIDDFGTGYSSLAYLKRFPIDKLKIDKSFVRDITTDAEDAAICSAIISLAHSLKLEVLAEGVETEEQLCFLRERGCDHAQGYLFSRPLPAAGLEALLTAESDQGGAMTKSA